MPRYEFSEGGSSKFWEIELAGRAFTTTYGRIGSAGQSTTKKLGSPAEAEKAYEKLIAEKTAKGYRLPQKAREEEEWAGEARLFELSDGSANKFWEITVDGKSFVTRYGRIGTDGQKTSKKWNTANLALEKAEELIAEKVGKGYAEKGGRKYARGDDAEKAAPARARNPELEQAIAADPDDEAAYLVYADWLQGQGDPRGELITLSAQAAKTKDRKLKNAADKLFAQHKADFLGPLAQYRKTLDGRDTAAMTWRWGFVQSLRIAFDQFSDQEREIDVHEMLATLLDHPSCRFLTDVVVGLYRTDDDTHYRDVIEALAEHPRPALRSLFVGDFDSDQSDISAANLGDFGRLWRKLPGLRKLILHGGSFTLGTVDLPELRHAEFQTGGMSRQAIRSIVNARWPKLEHLEVWFGSDQYGAQGNLNAIKPLLEGKGLPSLRHLGLMNCEFADDIARVIGKSKILPQLEILDLSMGTMSDAGADALVSSKAAFAKLKGLNLNSNCIGDAGVRRLKGLCRGLEVDYQRDEESPEDRYVEVGE